MLKINTLCPYRPYHNCLVTSFFELIMDLRAPWQFRTNLNYVELPISQDSVKNCNSHWNIFPRIIMQIIYAPSFDKCSSKYRDMVMRSSIILICCMTLHIKCHDWEYQQRHLKNPVHLEDSPNKQDGGIKILHVLF